MNPGIFVHEIEHFRTLRVAAAPETGLLPGMTPDAAIRQFSRLHPPAEKKLIAVSGGRDSVALLHALHEAGHHRLIICHLNHRLRGRESAGDAAFVLRLARKLGLPAATTAVSVKSEAAATGTSLEAAGRAARHRFFAECVRLHRCRTVLLAHHADDQAETVLYNLFRGSAGLRGMAAETDLTPPGCRRPLRLLRPFLEVRRADIDRWLASRNLPFRDDASNLTTDPVRNRIRLELLPAIHAAMQRDIGPALARAARIAADESSFLDQLAAPHAAGDELDARAVAAQPVALQRRIIHAWLRRHGFPGIGFQEVESVRGLLAPDGPAAINLPGNRFVRRHHMRLRPLTSMAEGR